VSVERRLGRTRPDGAARLEGASVVIAWSVIAVVSALGSPGDVTGNQHHSCEHGRADGRQAEGLPAWRGQR
jgi:hypothetical protein